MKFFSAGLTFVNVATIAGLLLGILGGGLDEGFAGLALFARPGGGDRTRGSARRRFRRGKKASVPPQPDAPAEIETRPAPDETRTAAGRWPRRRRAAGISGPGRSGLSLRISRSARFAGCSGSTARISRSNRLNNLGDLALHLTYIKYFANGVALWPDNPIYVFSKLRYPAGIDLFNALLLLAHIDLVRGLVWTGLLGSAGDLLRLLSLGRPVWRRRFSL